MFLKQFKIQIFKFHSRFPLIFSRQSRGALKFKNRFSPMQCTGAKFNFQFSNGNIRLENFQVPVTLEDVSSSFIQLKASVLRTSLLHASEDSVDFVKIFVSFLFFLIFKLFSQHFSLAEFSYKFTMICVMEKSQDMSKNVLCL